MFFNEKFDPLLPPITKTFYFDGKAKKMSFLKSLYSEMMKVDLKIKFTS